MRTVGRLRPTGRNDAERPHLSIEIAALDTERVRRAGDVPALRREGAHDVVPLESISRDMECEAVARVGSGPVRQRATHEKTEIRPANGLTWHHDRKPLEDVA